MFQDVNTAIEWLTSRRKSNFPFSDFSAYLQQLSNPQRQLKCLHVAGTNGKGSTTNYLRSILQKAGYRVGTFTSPHLVTHLDRIRVNDENMDEEFFLTMMNLHYQQWEHYQLSMFQIDMILSIFYFLEKKVDIAIYEVGLGGRLDATNVISPIGAIITNIEMDHMQILGDTIEKIAYEKAGIIKPGLPVVTFEKKKEALAVFEKVCEEKRAHLITTAPLDQLQLNQGINYTYRGISLHLPTKATYQILNSSAAVELILQLNQAGLLEVSEQQIIAGLETNWAGRFEVVSQNPTVIIDGAHNENGIEGLVSSLKLLNQEYVIIFSALADKQYHKMLGQLVKVGEVIVTEFENSRKETADELAAGYAVEVEKDYTIAIQKALTKGKTVVITGSLYFISIVRAYFINQ